LNYAAWAGFASRNFNKEVFWQRQVTRREDDRKAFAAFEGGKGEQVVEWPKEAASNSRI
jgi:hypothetical protein